MIDREGKYHPHIHCLLQEEGGYLPGYYFSNECDIFENDDPFPTLEEAEAALDLYTKQLNGIRD